MADTPSTTDEKPTQSTGDASVTTPVVTTSAADPVVDKTEAKVEVKTEVTPETKATETPAVKPEVKPEAKVEGTTEVPETYELTAPEGMTLSSAVIDGITPTFKELGLTNEKAQALTTKFIELQTTAMQTQQAAWLDEVKADTKLGGVNLERTQASVNRAVQAFGSEPFREWVNKTGLGNHPEFVRFVHAIGAAMADDEVLPAGRPDSPRTRDAAEMLYGNTGTP